MSDATIDDLLAEDRVFPPSPEFQAKALVSDRTLYDEAAADRLAFWARQARESLAWFEDFHTVLEWNLPFSKWFVGGKLNVAYNCLDRHVEAGRGDRVAYHWEGEPGDTRTITYSELLTEVKRFANVLKGLGVATGDRVAIYMPMIPELPVAMLACARIGARPLGHLRRVLPRLARRPDQRRRGQGAGHLRWRLPARRGLAAEAELRRRARVVPVDHRRRRGAPDRPGRRLDRRPGPLVARPDGGRVGRLRRRAPRQRAPAVPALHVGHDGQAQGHHAHHRGIPHPGGLHPPVRVRPAARRGRVLVRRRHRLGHRAQLHRLRPARQRMHGGDLRGDARHPGAAGRGCGTSSSATA